MKTLFAVMLAVLVATPALATPIATVRTVDANCYPIYYGYQVSIEGLVVSGTEQGSAGPAYIVDSTGGVAFYYFPMPFLTGDYVQLTAYVDFYRGLIELADDPVTAAPPTWTIISRGNPVVPVPMTIPQFNDANEGKLIVVECVHFLEGGTGVVFSYTHLFQDQLGNIGTMYTDTSTDIDGQLIPGGFVNLIGCLGQYDASSPYCEGYQVIPRSMNDIVASPSGTEEMSWSGVKALYR